MSVASGWDCHVHVFESGVLQAGAHYAPVERRLGDIEALAQAHGCGHLVLVQPSVYGTDNALLLRSLRAAGDRHRGVVVLHGREGDVELQMMHVAGVRGVRFNLVSPVGSTREEVPHLLAQLAPSLRRLGWHVQWYLRPQDLVQVMALQASSGLTFVLDHLAGLTPAHADDAAAWQALRTLAASGAWIKLSGWYRLQSAAPYDDLQPLVRRVAVLFHERMVWGSDWPHTSCAPDALPAYDSVWSPVVRALGSEAAKRIRAAGAQLYA